MTAAEYLMERGWVSTPTDDDDDYGDPCGCSDRPGEDGSWGWYLTDGAVLVQRARDAADEARAWVAFAAARLTCGLTGNGVEDAARDADRLLTEYSKRFAVEIDP